MPRPDMIYNGVRDTEGCAIVRVIDGDGVSHELPLRLDLANHSPTGFEWGYGGSGPAQLALAILAHATGNDRLACRLHQPFKWARIAGLDRDQPWRIYSDEVLRFAKQRRSAQRSAAERRAAEASK